MNDWPADPKLDAGLRDLADRELVAARSDAIGLTLDTPDRRGRQRRLQEWRHRLRLRHLSLRDVRGRQPVVAALGVAAIGLVLGHR